MNFVLETRKAAVASDPDGAAPEFDWLRLFAVSPRP